MTESAARSLDLTVSWGAGGNIAAEGGRALDPREKILCPSTIQHILGVTGRGSTMTSILRYPTRGIVSECLAALAGHGPLELGIGTGRVALPLARRTSPNWVALIGPMRH